ncbi:hypothetical protein GCK32_017101, partial [Trichostrongylus colubriformis]
DDQNGTKKELLASTTTADCESDNANHPRPPLLLVTEPSNDADRECPELWEESSDGDWTEAEDEADYESDEYSISQTFSLKDCMPIEPRNREVVLIVCLPCHLHHSPVQLHMMVKKVGTMTVFIPVRISTTSTVAGYLDTVVLNRLHWGRISVQAAILLMR